MEPNRNQSRSAFERIARRRRSRPIQRRAWRLFAGVACAILLLNPNGFGALIFGTQAVAQTAGDDDTQGSEQAGQHTEDGEHTGDAHDEHAGGHKDPVSDVLLAIVLILLAAKVCGDLFERVGMPAVLGELTVGIIIGNWAFITGLGDPAAGYHIFDFAIKLPADGTFAGHETAYVLDILARIGVVLLLFEIGLESRIKEMMSVGVSSLLVAILGVVAPMGLGWFAAWWLLPDAGWQLHAFSGATLCATSVGITARVLKDLGRSQQRESQIILGAAVIDDVLGLIVLAVISGIIQTGEFSAGALTLTIVYALGFLGLALILGAVQFPKLLFRMSSFLRGHGLLVVTALVICFGFSYAANRVDLAPIVGAFAAGLILEGAHYREVGKRWENHELEEAIAPLTALLVPIFFVGMGIQVNLASFGRSDVWMLAAVLSVVAVIGKQVCAWGVREKGMNRLAVGLGMIPRGEVGLIFVNEGKNLGVFSEENGTITAMVLMVMVTTLVTPPLLKWALERKTPPPETGTG